MKHPQTFLLEKIINGHQNKTGNLSTLDWKYVSEIAEVMREFAEETALDVLDRLNKGQAVIIKDNVICFSKRKANKLAKELELGDNQNKSI